MFWWINNNNNNNSSKSKQSQAYKRGVLVLRCQLEPFSFIPQYFTKIELYFCGVYPSFFEVSNNVSVQ